MRRILLSIIFLLFSLIAFANTANTITFSHNGETLKLNVTYNNEDDIRLSVNYIESSTETNVIYFWLNERVGVKQKYILAVCNEETYKNGVYNFRLSQDGFNDIAYNLHSISIGNKWKIVRPKDAYKVREYFIEKLLKQKDKKCSELKYTIGKLEKENERLNGVNKNLQIANDYYLKELKEIKEKYNEVTNGLSLQSANYTYQSTTSKTPSYTYERTTESERVYPPTDKNGKPRYKYKYKYWRNGKWRYRY